MALAQRRIPYAYQRPAAWQAPRPAPVVVPRPRVVLPALWHCLAAAFAAAGIAATYVHGDARMVEANHQRIAIQRLTGQLLTRRQRLHAEVIQRTSNTAVAQWAQSHGMEPAGDDAVLVYKGGQ
ncbi:MAG: hypothetical protein ACP5VE_01070 [Chthonomonadales bacterium]